MSSPDLSLEKPILEEAIDYNPLIVNIDISLTETLILMSQVQSSSCLLPSCNNSLGEYLPHKIRSNCVLVIKDNKLEGIFTERDLVRLIASRQKLEGVSIDDVMTKNVVTMKKENFQDIFAALFLFRRYKIRHLPIVDEQDNLIGVVSNESLRSCLRPTNLLKLRRVSDVMSSNVITASSDDSLVYIARLMAQHRVSCVVIMEDLPDELSLPIGIITERDILQFQTLALDLSQINAQKVMSTPLVLLNPDDSLWYANKQMQKMHLRRLVVSWNWGLGLGIITQTSLLKILDPMEMYMVIESLQKTVQQLESVSEGKSIETAKVKLESLENNLESEYSLQRSQLNSLIYNLQDNLKNLIDNSQMTVEKRQKLLYIAIDDVENLRKLLLTDLS